MRCAGTVWKEQFNLNLMALLYPVRDGQSFDLSLFNTNVNRKKEPFPAILTVQMMYYSSGDRSIGYRWVFFE